MATKDKVVVPQRAVHPGEILAAELKERGITQKSFAKSIAYQPTHLSEFIRGKRNLNETLAIKLEKALGIGFDTWMRLHSGYIYDLQLMEKSEKTSPRPEKTEKGYFIKLPARLDKEVSRLAEAAGMSVTAFIRQTMEKAISTTL